MALGILVSMVSVILCEALGHWVQHVLHFSKNKEYGFPLGVVASFGILEFLFLIGIGLHFGTGWFLFWSIVLIGFMVFALWSQWKKTVYFLFRWQTLVVLTSCVLGLVLMKRYASLEVSFIHTSLLQGFPLWQQTLQYSLRYVQISFGLWIILISFWFLGSLIFNIVDSFHLKNPWFCFCVLLAGIFFSTFRSHQLIQLGSMNYWRILLVSHLYTNDYFGGIVCVRWFCFNEWRTFVSLFHFLSVSKRSKNFIPFDFLDFSTHFVSG